MGDVLFILPAERHTFMLVYIGHRRSIRHHFGTIAFKNRIQYANDWSQKISAHIPMRKTAIRLQKEPAETLDFSGLAEMERFELSRVFTPLLHFECRPFNHLGTSPDEHDSVCRNFRAAVLPLLTQFTLCHISLIFASSKKRDCRRPAGSNSLSAAVQMPVSRFTPTRQDTAAGQRAASARSGSRLISAGSFC